MLVGLFTTRVVIRTLGEVDLGLYNVIGSVAIMLISIQESLSQASSRFLTFALGKGDEEEIKRNFKNVLTAHLYISILTLVVFETIGLYFFYKLNIPEGREFACFVCYQFTAISSCVTLLCVPFTASIIAHERMDFYAYMSIFDVVMKLVILYVIMVIPFDKLISYGALLLAVSLFGTAIQCIYAKKQFKETSLSITKDYQSLVDVFKFAGWNALDHFSQVISQQGGNFLLNIFFTPAVNAARLIGMQVSSITARFVSGIQTAISPQIIKQYAINDYEYMRQIMIKGSIYSFYILFILNFTIYFELPQIIRLWLGSYPDYTIIFVRIVMVQAILANTIINPLRTAINATGNLKQTNITCAIIYFSSLAITYILLKVSFPPQIVFIIIVVAYLIIIFFRVSFLSSLIGFSAMNYLLQIGGKVGTVSIICIISYFILHQLFPIQGFINILIPFTLSCGVVFTIGLSLQEKNYIFKLIKDKINHLK